MGESAFAFGEARPRTTGHLPSRRELRADPLWRDIAPPLASAEAGGNDARVGRAGPSARGRHTEPEAAPYRSAPRTIQRTDQVAGQACSHRIFPRHARTCPFGLHFGHAGAA